MSQITLPNQSVTGANLWSQVEDNDQAIVDVVNGDIDATNLADSAVETAKIDDDAVTTAKIDDGAVTAAKLATEAVLSGKLKVATFTASRTTTTWSSDTPSTHVIREITSVTPGIYLAVGEETANVTHVGPSFATSGGTATVTDAGSSRNSAGNTATTVTALIQVTATTTVQLILGKAGPTGSVSGSLGLYGIAAS